MTEVITETVLDTKANRILSLFEEQIPKYYGTTKIRAGQIQMALDIANFLNSYKNILLIEAPVGTGKSLGALVPSLIEGKFERFRRRLVYATATINLQGQLMNSEVPLLQEMGLLSTALLAKGKSHYYCHDRMMTAAKFLSKEDQTRFSTFFFNSSTGQRDELENEHGEVQKETWERINYIGTKRNCDQCQFSQSCATFHHRNQFLLPNDLVITNHEQLIRSVLNTLHDPPYPQIVPVSPGIIVIDEAHHFLENFLSAIEDKVSVHELKAIALRFPEKVKRNYAAIIDALKANLQRDAEVCESIQSRYPLPDYAVKSFSEISSMLSEELERYALKTINTTFKYEEHYSRALEKMISSIAQILNTAKYVSWLSYENFEFSNIPINFPTRFKQMMDRLSSSNKIVVMSGTLTTNGDFQSFLYQWRMSRRDVELKQIPQSFQYEKQSLVYVPEGVPDPRHEGWIEEQFKYYEDLLGLTGGRTLILSTSKQHMQTIFPSLQEICSSLNATLLLQEQSGVEQLTKRFKEDETSVLLGSGSFFSGFSVTGTSLVSVMFSRLPFPVPDDPYLRLIGSGLEDVFMEEVLVPHMMVKLNQGVGRLIRDINDYGIITILDPRVFQSAYGNLIRADFEKKGYRFTRSFSEVIDFYQQKLLHGSEAYCPPYTRDLIRIPPALMREQKVTVPVAPTIKKAASPRYRNKVITPDQLDFAKRICSERGVKLSAKPKKGEDLYMYLYNLYFSKYNNPDVVRDSFPYANERAP